MDEYAYLLKFVPNENRARLFIFIKKVFYCDLFTYICEYLLQIIIKDIENEKVRCVFQNN